MLSNGKIEGLDITASYFHFIKIISSDFRKIILTSQFHNISSVN